MRLNILKGKMLLHLSINCAHDGGVSISRTVEEFI